MDAAGRCHRKDLSVLFFDPSLSGACDGCNRSMSLQGSECAVRLEPSQKLAVTGAAG